MNVLTFVISMLMVLAILTYARLDSFRASIGVQKELEKYMQAKERKYPNGKAEDWYKQIVVISTNKTKKASVEKPKKINAIRRISWYPFINREFREKNPNIYHQIRAWSKSLITILFDKKPFFLEAQEHDPNFIENIFDGIIKASEDPVYKDAIKKVDDIANIKLDDDYLNGILYQLLKEIPDPFSNPSLVYEAKSEKNEGDSLDPNPFDEKESIKEENEEHKPQEGEISLLNYISLNSETKIRLYLAPYPVLLAITGNNKATVDHMIVERRRLYREVNRDMATTYATDLFRNTFSGNFSAVIDYVDFSVTNTDPDR